MKTTLKFLSTGLIVLAMTMASCSSDDIEGLQGAIGPQGEQGIQGPEGPQGPAGEDGEALGVPGPPGEEGETGATGPQGDTGPAGPAGADGADGTNGTDGADGADGTDGNDGTNGADGEDGNANVRTFIYDMSSKNGPTIIQNVPALTQDVLDNDLILGYLKTVDREFNPIPAPRFLAAGLKDVTVDFEIGKYQFFFYEVGSTSLTSISAGTLDELKVIVAESTSTSGKSGKQGILDDMKSKGISLDDYHAVMDYFKLSY